MTHYDDLMEGLGFESTRKFVRVLIALDLLALDDGFPLMLDLETYHYLTIMDIRDYCANWSKP